MPKKKLDPVIATSIPTIKDNAPDAIKDRTFDLFSFSHNPAPSKCSNVVVITEKYTYQGKLIGYGRQDGIVKKVLVDPNSSFWGARWESVHDVFEVE